MNTLSYQETIDYLYAQLPMFSKVGKDAIKADLTNIHKLCDALGNPQDKFKAIHIAGTNGKGSTSHMLSAVLQEAGYNTGLYTSPHLVDFRERIRVNGIPVSKEWVTNFVATHRDLIDDVQPSFFEVTVAMAFAAFADARVDIAIIETGLGGRLDSTNIITPILSIITNISYDHKDVLGDTLADIAGEKAGIIKHKVPVVVGEQHPETESVFFQHALRNQTTVYYAETLWDMVRTGKDVKYQHYKAIHKAKREIHKMKTDLLGGYQSHNIKTVLAAAEVLEANQGIALPLQQIFQALTKVKQLTGLRGRWDWLQHKPLVIADVGHNAAGIKEVMDQWNKLEATQKHVLVGFVKDKDVHEALRQFPRDAVYYFCNAQIPRAMAADKLKDLAAIMELKGEAYPTVADAIKAAKENMQQDDALLITGSFFIVGEAMEAIGAAQETKQLGLFAVQPV